LATAQSKFHIFVRPIRNTVRNRTNMAQIHFQHTCASTGK